MEGEGNGEEDDTQDAEGERRNISASDSVNEVDQVCAGGKKSSPVYDYAGRVTCVRARPIWINISVCDGAAIMIRHGLRGGEDECHGAVYL